MIAARECVIADLRERISALEGLATRKADRLPFAVSEIDAVLPGGGLSYGALHEFAGGGADTVDGAAAALFAAGIAARTRGPVVWCLTRPDYRAKGAIRDVGKALGLPEEGLRPYRADLAPAPDCLFAQGFGRTQHHHLRQGDERP